MEDFKGWALSITRETVDKHDDYGFDPRSNGVKAISDCSPYFFTEHIEILHYILSLKPNLAILEESGMCIVGDPLKTQICLSYGYRFPNLIETIMRRRGRGWTSKQEFYPSFRLLFEHGTLCPPEKYCMDLPWIFDLYDEVITRRQNCARACVALAGVSKRVRSQRDVLSIVIKLVWETRRKDAWLYLLE